MPSSVLSVLNTEQWSIPKLRDRCLQWNRKFAKPIWKSEVRLIRDIRLLSRAGIIGFVPADFKRAHFSEIDVIVAIFGAQIKEVFGCRIIDAPVIRDSLTKFRAELSEWRLLDGPAFDTTWNFYSTQDYDIASSLNQLLHNSIPRMIRALLLKLQDVSPRVKVSPVFRMSEFRKSLLARSGIPGFSQISARHCHKLLRSEIGSDRQSILDERGMALIWMKLLIRYLIDAGDCDSRFALDLLQQNLKDWDTISILPWLHVSEIGTQTIQEFKKHELVNGLEKVLNQVLHEKPAVSTHKDRIHPALETTFDEVFETLAGISETSKDYIRNFYKTREYWGRHRIIYASKVYEGEITEIHRCCWGRTVNCISRKPAKSGKPIEEFQLTLQNWFLKHKKCTDEDCSRIQAPAHAEDASHILRSH